MAVLRRFVRPVTPEQEALGRQLVRDDAVQVIQSRINLLTAQVHTESGTYEASLDWSDPGLSPTCDCPAFQRTGQCAHVVALALVIERKGLYPRSHEPGETRPRGRSRNGMWLSSSGDLVRLDADRPRPPIRHEPSLPSWRKQLAKLRDADDVASPAQTLWPESRELVYVVDVALSDEERTLVIRLACRDRRSTGEWSRPKTRGVSFPAPGELPNAEDRHLLALLKGSVQGNGFQQSYEPVYRVPSRMRVMLVERMCATGRAMLKPAAELDDYSSLAWDAQAKWEFWVEGRRHESTEQYVFMGALRRGEQRVPLSRPLLMLEGGLVFFPEVVAELDDGGAFSWISMLRRQRSIQAPLAQHEDLLAELMAVPRLPRLDLPEELRVQRVSGRPQPHLKIRAARNDELRPDRLRAVLSFDYDGATVLHRNASRIVYQAKQRRIIDRDLTCERTAYDRLRNLGMREAMSYSAEGPELWFNQRNLPRMVRMLVLDGWAVEVEGKLYRRASNMRLKVSSGIDWFELRGEIDFGDRVARMPELMAAIRRGDAMVQLDDGTFGLLPEQWLQKYGVLASAGSDQGEFLKFMKNQVGLLDALLASQPDATWDEAFERARGELAGFEGIQAAPAPRGFIGQLRAYQQEGLGWFEFLERFGFGGCLADDMGLGKTVQVLALLEQRRQKRRDQRAAGQNGQALPPSLAVVPKSLVFNWKQEAERFVPDLRLLDHTGIDRARSGEHLPDCDLIITTYGTLRRDVEFLKDIEFDYVVLDEAQAVKNASSESAKAVRLLRGRNRLVLSGTPVQNHLGDLWSLFEFLNPGMLGSASLFTATGAVARNPDEQTRGLLSRALRPFILRRTKEQVASELPPKLEQTIYCELESDQRRLYDELRDHYRRTLLGRIDHAGIGAVKIEILEALLRLRQAALHPGLLDGARADDGSAKLDVLLPMVDEVLDEGHKALVFSQFTSLLSIVRRKLDERGIVYEYLDGQTRDREQRVRRFQEDADCKLFLISLKAGGLGLNLTAADYVFLLDPWWNPAVEQQAIDRAHRIGQTRHVYACRLIAKDTVEEKVLALQQSKRDLADAIITADNSLLSTIGREELELLLS